MRVVEVEAPVRSTTGSRPDVLLEPGDGGRAGACTGPRVIVGYDGSAASDVALDVATEEAFTRGLPLSVVCALEPPLGGPVHLSSQRGAAEAALADAANRAAEVLGAGGVTDELVVGSPSARLVGACRPGDLLVVGTHGHRPVARMLLGSVSAAAVAHAPCPVLVARASRSAPGAPVVVGVDGSASSLAALAAAAEIADTGDVPLRAVLALPPFVDALGFVTAASEAEQEQARALLRDAVDVVLAAHQNLPVEEELVQAHPVDALLRASRHAGVAVVGSRGRGGVRSMLMGSVSRELVHRAPCSVLVVRGSRGSQPASEPALRSRGELLRPA